MDSWYPDPVNGKRNYSYMQAVKVYLGGTMQVICGSIVYGKLAGITVGYTITSSISLAAIESIVCVHRKGHEADCSSSYNPYMISFGTLQIFLSQIPNFHELTWISTVAAITSFGYVFIAIALCFNVIISGNGASTSITGIKIGPELSLETKVWRIMSSMGNIALACTYATVIYDIMDTLKSHPSENKQMKKANVIGVSTMTMIFLLCSCLGYAAFGDHTPGNIFAGFHEPYWLVVIGDICIVIHMIGAYQVMGQPFFRFIEMGANIMWPISNFINKEHPISLCGVTINLNLFRLIWRTIFVILGTTLAMAMPFFNQILALLGAIGFGPLVVFFPIQMHIAQKGIRPMSLRWCALQCLNCVCFLVSLAAVVASIHEISKNLHKFKIFAYKQ
ncbi:amino acid permease 8 isoform X2 [Medicago truncatula]|uniref:Transmembrane amino acid transporter family protein n=1 Tax=Medicago truncatula TaxID=3880 RepID=A0A072V5J6_MEDTR|nr:amino acid permease 8 isoform X2 [Medicago truncatula]KEH37102.1 transmembrane amino acid transporter family protein [Medicago truncatula]